LSLSMHDVSLILKEDKALSVSDLGFLTTVLRDNAQDDGMYKYYSEVLKLIIKMRKAEGGEKDG